MYENERGIVREQLQLIWTQSSLKVEIADGLKPSHSSRLQIKNLLKPKTILFGLHIV